MIVSLEGVTVARAGRPVLENLNINIAEEDRVFIAGENGAGKTTLLALFAGRLHPHGAGGSRIYAWEGASGESFRESRKHIAYISREEQHRLQKIHASSTLRHFVIGHSDGADFLYRDISIDDMARADAAILAWQASHLVERKIRTLSLGEMRLALIIRAALHPRRLYVFDELFSGLSTAVLGLVFSWIRALPLESAVVMTSHDNERAAGLNYSRHYVIESGKLEELIPAAAAPLLSPATETHFAKSEEIQVERPVLITCEHANFFHDFTCIFRDLSFHLREGDRVLLTGPNGSGKSTLLRIMHGDFYPEFATGPLVFSGALAHDLKSDLWKQVQFVAAAHFTYFPVYMSVHDVLASRYSGSIYEYPEVLPETALPTVEEFALQDLLRRQFYSLSEGKKPACCLPARFFFLRQSTSSMKVLLH